MLLSSFAAPRNGSHAFICGPASVHLRPPLFETTVFVARNGFLQFPEIKFPPCFWIFLGCTPKGAYSTRGRSRHLLETPLLRTPSENPSQNPFYL